MAYEPSTQFHAAASYVTNAPQLDKVSNNVKLEVRPVLARVIPFSHLPFITSNRQIRILI